MCFEQCWLGAEDENRSLFCPLGTAPLMFALPEYEVYVQAQRGDILYLNTPQVLHGACVPPHGVATSPPLGRSTSRSACTARRPCATCAPTEARPGVFRLRPRHPSRTASGSEKRAESVRVFISKAQRMLVDRLIRLSLDAKSAIGNAPEACGATQLRSRGLLRPTSHICLGDDFEGGWH